MAAEPLPGQGLTILHERITRAAAELRFRTRPPASGEASVYGSARRRVPDDLLRAAEGVLRGVHLSPRLIASVAAGLLVAAGVAAVLAVRGRRM